MGGCHCHRRRQPPISKNGIAINDGAAVIVENEEEEEEEEEEEVIQAMAFLCVLFSYKQACNLSI